MSAKETPPGRTYPGGFYAGGFSRVRHTPGTRIPGKRAKQEPEERQGTLRRLKYGLGLRLSVGCGEKIKVEKAGMPIWRAWPGGNELKKLRNA